MGTRTAHNNFKDENLNPCLEEGKLTTKCLQDNYYNSEKCLLYYENYRNCLRFWGVVKRLRMKNFIKPTLPDKEERVKILKEREKGNNIYQAK